MACGILVPRPGPEPVPSAVKVQSPNHWTPRKFLMVLFFDMSADCVCVQFVKIPAVHLAYVRFSICILYFNKILKHTCKTYILVFYQKPT